MDAFDADVLIYAASPTHPMGGPVRDLLLRADRPAGTVAGVGSLLLLPELLGKPVRDGASHEVRALAVLLGRLELLPVDVATAELGTALSARYRLRAADAIHLATAVGAGATRFVTNNRRDFARSITEIDITYPTDLTT